MYKCLSSPARRVGVAMLAAALSLSTLAAVPMLSGCSSEGLPEHEEKPPREEWTVIATSDDGEAQLLVHDESGIEYIALASGSYGMCERWDSDGTFRRDGDATKGGKFALDVVEERKDDSGETSVLRDRQTGIAYLWHRWSTGHHMGYGLVPYFDSQGRLQRYDDSELFPVSVREDLVETYEDPAGRAEEPVDGGEAKAEGESK